MSIIMDFTTTAVVRPQILDRTLGSFSKNLKDINLKECRLVINIDPLPPNRRKHVIQVARKYFGEVKYNLPKQANFTAAYNWIWSNAKTEYIFNLEDDWELIKPISIKKILYFFEKNNKLLQVIIRAYKYTYTTCALSPSVLHRRFYSAVGGNLKIDINPEIQLRGNKFGIQMPSRSSKTISHKGSIIVYPEYIKSVVLRDIGRQWIRKSKYRKTGSGRKGRFITWETKK